MEARFIVIQDVFLLGLREFGNFIHIAIAHFSNIGPDRRQYSDAACIGGFMDHFTRNQFTEERHTIYDMLNLGAQSGVCILHISLAVVLCNRQRYS